MERLGRAWEEFWSQTATTLESAPHVAGTAEAALRIRELSGYFEHVGRWYAMKLAEPMEDPQQQEPNERAGQIWIPKAKDSPAL